MRFARVIDGIVIEIMDIPEDVLEHLPEGSSLKDVFHPDIARDLIEAGKEVDQGWMYSYTEGDFHAPAPGVIDLDELKRDLANTVDIAAEQARLKYITPGAGQAMTYQQKVEEARRFKETGAGDYPMLSAEVGITAKTIAEVAETILASFAQWQHVGAQIESARLGAKVKIAAAKTEKAARAASAVEWP